jgi:hypothetical protein
MNIFKAIMFVCSMSLTGAALAQAPVVNPYGQFFEGDGVEIEMAQLAKKNADGLYDVLLKFTGKRAFNAGIDGKTLTYVAVHGGTGIDYQLNGKTRMIVRNPYGNSWRVMEVFLDGDTVAVAENKEKSKEVRPLHLLTASKEQSSK